MLLFTSIKISQFMPVNSDAACRMGTHPLYGALNQQKFGNNQS